MNAERKQQIIRASLKRFIKHGLHKTTLDEIARDLRIGKATLYYYFSSKEELYQETLKYELSLFFDEVNLLFFDETKSVENKIEDYYILKEQLSKRYILFNRLIHNILLDNFFESELLLLSNFQKEMSTLLRKLISVNNNLTKDIQKETESIILYGWGRYFNSQIKKNN